MRIYQTIKGLILPGKEEARIVDANLEKMFSSGRDSMKYLLYDESMGGTCPDWNDISCGGTNFYYDSKGQIKEFGNCQHVSKEILSNYQGSLFRIAHVWQKYHGKNDPEMGIVDIRFLDSMDEKPKKVLLRTQKEYNERVGFTEEFQKRVERDYQERESCKK